ncbi:MAG TPA: outer membrane beta-barrel protein [Rubricoccaceae bacterium]|jgi:hypothetical protein
MRFLPLALAALAFAPAAQAQLLPSISLGVAGGPNFASLNDVGAELENSTGYHVGVYGDISVPFVSFRTGVFYLKAGDVESSTTTTTADFITVPVDLRFSTPTPVVQAYALAGPEFRFPVGGEEDGLVVETKSVNVAANVGAGVSFNPPLVGPSGFLELRYSQDVTAFAEEAGLTTENEYKLSMVQLRLGIGL